MTKQQEAALETMREWLAHPQELGKAPAKIEVAGEFDLHDCHYYILKYKKSPLGKWLVGVCGFEDGETLEPCGHTFSQMEPYDPADALEKCQAMVDCATVIKYSRCSRFMPENLPFLFQHFPALLYHIFLPLCTINKSSVNTF